MVRGARKSKKIKEKKANKVVPCSVDFQSS